MALKCIACSPVLMIRANRYEASRTPHTPTATFNRRGRVAPLWKDPDFLLSYGGVEENGYTAVSYRFCCCHCSRKTHHKNLVRGHRPGPKTSEVEPSQEKYKKSVRWALRDHQGKVQGQHTHMLPRRALHGFVHEHLYGAGTTRIWQCEQHSLSQISCF